jgi:dTDP-4-amino-4,6-dideoxygalactose transaminase
MITSTGMRQIQMVDLQVQYQRMKEDIDSAIQQVLNHAGFINGPEVVRFAASMGQYLDVAHVIPCANGTDALQLALMALDLKPGDEVITPAFTFISTVEVIALLGLTPVLADVLPSTFTLDPSSLEKAITSKTRAIIPVHLFGQGANMEEILTIAQRHHLYVVEDAAQCLGAGYLWGDGNSRKLGTLGDIGCTSFFPSKNLGCYGDGGACFTNNPQLAQKLKLLANHGSEQKYLHREIGINSRLDTLQAAVLGVKLEYLNDFIHRRQQLAKFYDASLSQLPGLIVPQHNDASEHSFHQYTVRVLNGQRDALKKFLINEGIPTMVYYPYPINHQPAFERWTDREKDFPVAEQLCHEVLSLPMHTEVDAAQAGFIVNAVIRFFTGRL